MKHPLAIGLILLIQTFLICLIIGLIIKSFWFSYILFLIFLGGLLVLFIYVTSLASNEIFSFSRKIIFNITFFYIIFIIFFIINDKLILINYLKNFEISKINNKASFFLENRLILNKLYNFPTNIISIILIIYLFFTLIAIVKITNIFEGPLRPKIF